MKGKQICFVESGRTEVLLDFVAGSLDPRLIAQVEKHAVECGACQTFVAQQAEVWAALEGDAAPAVSADFDARLYSKIAEADAESWWTRTWRWFTAMATPSYTRPAMALSVALTVIVAVSLTQGNRLDVPVAGTQAVAVQTSDLDAIEQTLSDLEMLQTLGELPKAL